MSAVVLAKDVELVPGVASTQISSSVSRVSIELDPQQAGRLQALMAGAATTEEDEDFLDELGALGFLDGAPADRELIRELREQTRAVERSEELAVALGFLKEHIPRYRDALAEIDVQQAAADPATWAQIPTMDRSDVRADFPRRLSSGLVDEAVKYGRLSYSTTSGTSGERLTIFSDRKAVIDPPNLHAFFGLRDDLVPDRRALLTTPICAGFQCTLGAHTMQERIVHNTLTLNSSDDLFFMTDEEVENVIAEWTTYAPYIVMIHPWYAARIALRAQGLGLELPRPDLLLSTYQYLTLRHRKLLSELFACPVRTMYSATELGGHIIATECHCGHLHLREDHHFTEVIDADEQGIGTVLVTSVKNQYVPLLRYRIGDVGRFVDGCSCEYGPEWRSFEIHGRAKDAVVGADSRRWTTKMIDDLVGENGPDFYQLVQTERGVTLSTLTGTGDAQGAAGRIGEALGHPVEVQEVEDFTPEASLKFLQTGRR